MEKCIILKNGLDYQKKRAKRKDTSDEKFLTAVVNFLIMALIIFVMVKIVNKAVALGKKLEPKSDEKEEAPTTKICPFCKTEINIDAVRCPNCTSVLNSEEK